VPLLPIPVPQLGRNRTLRQPLAPFRDLLSAFRQDVSTTRHAVEPARLLPALGQSRRPADAAVHAAESPAFFASDAICTAPSINFWQDIGL
jgi:hypothetical protein